MVFEDTPLPLEHAVDVRLPAQWAPKDGDNALLLWNALAIAVIYDGVDAVEASHIKYVATGNAIRAVEIGLELTGNPGLSRKNPLERHYRDVLCSRIHSPQNDTILVGAGRAAFGL